MSNDTRFHKFPPRHDSLSKRVSARPLQTIGQVAYFFRGGSKSQVSIFLPQVSLPPKPPGSLSSCLLEGPMFAWFYHKRDKVEIQEVTVALVCGCDSWSLGYSS